MNYAEIKKYYDKFGYIYDKERMSGYFAFINKLETEIAIKHIENKDILEIGCGTGIILNQTSKLAKNAIGVDLSDGMLEVAKKKNLTVQKANATNLPFPDNSFDVVYSFKVLAHIPDIQLAIREIIRVTKPGGKLILEFYNPYSLKGLVGKISGFIKKQNVYIRFDSYKKIKSYLPSNIVITDTYGIKIVLFSNSIFSGNIFQIIERKLATTPLKYLGGYFVITATNK